MEIQSTGTIADKEAKVDISKVHGGYFSHRSNLEIFVKLGIQPLEKYLPKSITYIDFGGGQGHLALYIKEYLNAKGFNTETTVLDANDTYLMSAKEKGLNVELCNLETFNSKEIDLITMRAVLHYNSQEKQKEILKNVFNSLKIGGYFVHQNSSGNKENCELRSAIVNLSELGRAGVGSYHWVSEDEYSNLIKDIGFSDSIHAGYAVANSWGPEEQWDRFNSEKTNRAILEKNTALISEIEIRKNLFLQKAHQLILEYGEKYGNEYVGIQEGEDGSVVIKYPYPIIIARK